MKKISFKIAAALVLLSLISVFLPYGEAFSWFDKTKDSSVVQHGYSLIYPILSVVVLLIITYLFYSPKRKRDLILAIILSLGNILIIAIIYNQLRSQAFWSGAILKYGIGFYILEFCSIGIALLSILRVINLKAFVTAKREYEEIVSKEFQSLK